MQPTGLAVTSTEPRAAAPDAPAAPALTLAAATRGVRRPALPSSTGRPSVIRPATTVDVDSVLDLADDLYQEDGSVPFVRESAAMALRELLTHADLGRVWVVDEAAGVIGYLALTWGFSLEFHGRDAFVDEVFVAPSHRGRGLGSQLLEAAEAACRAHGARALHLAVERSNRRAHELYVRAGFREHDRYLMTKRLDEEAD